MYSSIPLIFPIFVEFFKQTKYNHLFFIKLFQSYVLHPEITQSIQSAALSSLINLFTTDFKYHTRESYYTLYTSIIYIINTSENQMVQANILKLFSSIYIDQNNQLLINVNRKILVQRGVTCQNFIVEEERVGPIPLYLDFTSILDSVISLIEKVKSFTLLSMLLETISYQLDIPQISENYDFTHFGKYLHNLLVSNKILDKIQHHHHFYKNQSEQWIVQNIDKPIPLSSEDQEKLQFSTYSVVTHLVKYCTAETAELNNYLAISLSNALLNILTWLTDKSMDDNKRVRSNSLTNIEKVFPNYTIYKSHLHSPESLESDEIKAKSNSLCGLIVALNSLCIVYPQVLKYLSPILSNLTIMIGDLALRTDILYLSPILQLFGDCCIYSYNYLLDLKTDELQIFYYDIVNFIINFLSLSLEVKHFEINLMLSLELLIKYYIFFLPDNKIYYKANLLPLLIERVELLNCPWSQMATSYINLKLHNPFFNCLFEEPLIESSLYQIDPTNPNKRSMIHFISPNSILTIKSGLLGMITMYYRHIWFNAIYECQVKNKFVYDDLPYAPQFSLNLMDFELYIMSHLKTYDSEETDFIKTEETVIEKVEFPNLKKKTKKSSHYFAKKSEALSKIPLREPIILRERCLTAGVIENIKYEETSMPIVRHLSNESNDLQKALSISSVFDIDRSILSAQHFSCSSPFLESQNKLMSPKIQSMNNRMLSDDNFSLESNERMSPDDIDRIHFITTPPKSSMDDVSLMNELRLFRSRSMDSPQDNSLNKTSFKVMNEFVSKIETISHNKDHIPKSLYLLQCEKDAVDDPEEMIRLFDPFFSNYQYWNTSEALKVHDSPDIQKKLRILDRTFPSHIHRIGVIYVKQGQNTEEEIMLNSVGTADYENFLSLLGKRVVLSSLNRRNTFIGGLSQNGSDGEIVLIYHDQWHHVAYHVTTLLPTDVSNSSTIKATMQLKRKHIGNDFVNIIYTNNSSFTTPFPFQSNFTCVYIVVIPSSPNFVTVSVYAKQNIPPFGPLLLGSSIHLLSTAIPLIRQTAINADFLCRYIYQDSVDSLSPVKDRFEIIKHYYDEQKK